MSLSRHECSGCVCEEVGGAALSRRISQGAELRGGTPSGMGLQLGQSRGWGVLCLLLFLEGGGF